MRTSLDPVRSCAATTETPVSRDETAVSNPLDGRRSFPADIHDGAAQKVNAVARTAIYQQADESGQSEKQRWQDEPPLPAKKIKMRVFK